VEPYPPAKVGNGHCVAFARPGGPPAPPAPPPRPGRGGGAGADSFLPALPPVTCRIPGRFGPTRWAWARQFLSEGRRLADARKGCNIWPLGSASLAGTVYPLDRHYVADLLGFDGITENSLDAVSDRDFAIETVSACALIMVHLSRWSEELILWSTPMFGFVSLPDRFCTGSSIMPQKKTRRGRGWCVANRAEGWAASTPC